ncbi:hypothetical protein FVE85_1778 [Porphyridium purpureum]|uniref:Uncharacterized protein n=1 Tax=Porphyridium purpureum TaxID=35688 RepID=A0A5J4YYC1_PORPP|nr:hypothetical protein FVE85_1778 [Porphyridium purpureum]|eukprot:POR1488..scf209_3
MWVYSLVEYSWVLQFTNGRSWHGSCAAQSPTQSWNCASHGRDGSRKEQQTNREIALDIGLREWKPRLLSEARHSKQR